MSIFKASILATLDTSKIESQVANLKIKTPLALTKFKLDTSGLPNQIQGSLDSHKFTIYLDGIKMANIESQMGNVGTVAGRNIVNKIQQQLSSGKIEADIAKVTAQYQTLLNADKNGTMHNQLALVNADLTEMGNLQRSMLVEQDSTKQISQYTKYEQVLKSVRNTLATLSAENKIFVSSSEILAQDNKIAAWMQENTKASKHYGTQLQTLRQALAELGGREEGTVLRSELSAINSQFTDITNSAQRAGETGKSFSTILQNGFKRVLSYASASTLIFQAVNALKQMYQAVYNIDVQMTELKKVTNETDETYTKFLKNAAATATQIGTTISNLISSTADFARLGYSFSDAQVLAQVANIYSVVGDELDGIDGATKSLISTMTAFNSQMGGTMSQGDFALSIVDKFNEVSNNFAISSGGIGEALERSASSLAAANNTLDESIALITAAEINWQFM